MTGGVLSIDTVPIEQRDRTAGGSLVYRKVALKKVFNFNFKFILPDHFNIWAAQQTFIGWRELEYEEEDGTFSRVVVNFKGVYGKTKVRTDSVWLYGDTLFIMEEV